MPLRKFLILALTLPAVAQTPAFPGAEDYGAYAKGGRGGDVYHVTNLNASGAGSFIEGITTVPSAGRTIVFDVSGYIRFPSGSGGTRMTASKVTIAGQTAPGDGIGFYNNAFRISGDDVIVRHLRFRLGKYGTGGDCLNLDSGSVNSILDHLSVQFSTDENISSFSSPPENLTLQYSLNAWGLESHSCGGLWDQNHATSHHNLWAHNHTRNPKARPAGLLEWINNVTFDWDIGFIMGDSDTPATWKSNVIGNYYICPPGNIRSKALEKANLDRNGNPNFSLYMSDNYYDGDGNATLDGALAGYGLASGSYIAAASPFSNTGSRAVAVDSAPVAYKKVVSNAGALRLDAGYSGAIRDEVDTILVSKLVNLQRAHITRESDTGASAAGFGVLNSAAAPIDTDKDAMPDFYETALGWNPAVQDHNTVLANSGGLLTGTTFMPAGTVSGYTRLEEYLHFLSIPHGTVAKNVSGAATSLSVDLGKFTSGFSSSPTFAVSNITGGGVALSGPGNAIATFTPTQNHVGRGRFDFTVTDSAGHSWTRTFALLVANSGLPRDLNWNGAGNLWDSSSINWFRPANGTNAAFSAGDRVTFDQSGIAQPTVSVSGTNSPGSVTVNAQGNYTFSGTGAISSSGELIKRGSGTLNVSNTGPNGFTSVSVDEGWLSLGNFTAAGSGKMSLNGGSLYLASGTGNPLEFNASTTISVGSQHTMTGNWTGSQEVTVTGTSSHLWTLSGTWAGFTGSVRLGAGNVRIRLNGGSSNSMFGSPNVSVDLGSGTGQIMNRNGGSMDIGSLAATGTGTLLYGTQTGSTNSTYNIGGLNADTTFAGGISNGGSGSLTSINKVGNGSLTLTGTSTHTGTTAVNVGSLIVAGTLDGSPVTVASGALLAGSGNLNGGVTASGGSFMSPGTVPFTGATMNVSNGLSLGATTVHCDLSSSPGGANDKIVVNSGTLTYTGTPNFQFLLLGDSLGAGNYDLITAPGSSVPGGTPGDFPHNLPTGTRQTFTVKRSSSGVTPAKVWLEVLGDPATLTWTGGASADWDMATANNWTGASPNTFGANDAVVFDDSTANRTVTLAGSLAPRSVTVNTAAGYTLTGAGTVNGGGSFVKSGAGTLWLAGTSASTFTGGFTLNAGTVAFQTDAASNAALGVGPVTLNGGTLSMYSNFSSYDSFTAALVVPDGRTATLNADSRVDMHGSLTGAGTLNLSIPANRTSLFLNSAGFSGVLNATTPGGYAELRMSQDYNPSGFPNAAVNLGANVVAVFAGNINQGGGTSIGIGALSGPSSSKLLGGPEYAGSRLVTYRIGGKGGDATFSGKIEEQNPAVTNTSIIKTGTGIWTLAGASTYNGGTTVEQGTLRLSGSIASGSTVLVNSGAAFDLAGGTLACDALNIGNGSNFVGYGALLTDLICNGGLEGRGFASGVAGTLDISGSAFLDGASLRMLAGGSTDRIAVTGDLSLAGTVQINLVPGTGFGRYTLVTCGGDLILGPLVLTGIPGGTTAHLSATAGGKVDLVINDSDEDGLPDSWENLYFGNLASGPGSDNDGDGQGNAMELLAGTLPNSGASRFAATLTPLGGNQFNLTWPSVPGKSYRLESCTTLAGTWAPLITVPAADSPATTTSHVIGIATGPGRSFYRVALDP